jgi:hypothetical protein
MNWFTATTSHPINQNHNYDHLDSEHTRKDVREMKGRSRSTIGDWTKPEEAFFEWQQYMEQEEAIITSEILKTKANPL